MISVKKAFEVMKHKLTSAPVMALPQDDAEYILDTDASNCHIGAVLSIVQDGQEKVVAYGSRLYSKAEQNYCVTRKELLAIVYFTKLYKHYLLGRHFKIRTDHAALQWLKKTPEPIGQQSRWLEQLEAFDFAIEHRAGKKHQNADSMSRIPCQQCRRTDDEVDVVQVISHAHESGLQDDFDFWSDENIAKLQEKDLDVGEFYKLKKSNGDPETRLDCGPRHERDDQNVVEHVGRHNTAQRHTLSKNIQR